MHHQGSQTFTDLTTAIDNAGGYAIGTTEIVVDSVAGLRVGDVLTIDSERVTVSALDTDTETITLTVATTAQHNNNATVTRVGTTESDILDGTKLGSLPSTARSYRCFLYARAFGASDAVLGVGMTHTLEVNGVEIFKDSEVPRQLIAGAAAAPAVAAAFPSPDDIPVDEFQGQGGDKIKLDVTNTAAGVYRYRIVAVPE